MLLLLGQRHFKVFGRSESQTTKSMIYFVPSKIYKVFQYIYTHFKLLNFSHAFDLWSSYVKSITF